MFAFAVLDLMLCVAFILVIGSLYSKEYGEPLTGHLNLSLLANYSIFNPIFKVNDKFLDFKTNIVIFGVFSFLLKGIYLLIKITKRKRDSRDSNKDEANGHEHAYYFKSRDRRAGGQRPTGSGGKGRKGAALSLMTKDQNWEGGSKMATKKERKKPVVEIEFTPGYEQRFTRAILKIYEKREREAMEAERKAQEIG